MSRVLSRDEMEDLLHQEKAGRLGLSYQDNPYVIPLCFVYHQEALFFHCSLKGKKMDYLRGNCRACFQVDQVGEIISTEKPCKFNLNFRSVLVEGAVSIVTRDEEKLLALQQLIKKFAGSEIADRLTPKDLRKVQVLKLTIQSLSGRAVE